MTDDIDQWIAEVEARCANAAEGPWDRDCCFEAIRIAAKEGVK